MNINLHFDNPGNVSVVFPDADATMSLPMERTGLDTYRVRAVPIVSDSVGYADLVRVKELQDGTLRILEIVERANWQVFEWALSRHLASAPETQRFREMVEEVGGYWEQIFGGMLIVCLPPESAFQAEAVFQQLSASRA